MNRLSKEQRIKILAALVEGNSLRATARMCDVAFNTVLKLVPQIGLACVEYAARLANRVQLTTDGHRAYLEAVESAFGSDIDYSMLVKIYGEDSKPDSRYSPAECIGCQHVGITGRPNPQHVSTSHVERQNLTMRMSIRRFTRLTNAFSKKLENHVAAVALHYMYYNFCRIHQTLRVTPAMAAGISDHVWDVSDIASLLDSK